MGRSCGAGRHACLRGWPAIFLAVGLWGFTAQAGATALHYESAPAANSLDYHPVALAPGQRPLVLALGGGGAKGIAHVGVLQRLQEEGIPVSGIAGTSAGAFVGGLYAAGYSGTAIESLLGSFDLGSLMLDRDRRIPGATLREQAEEEVNWLHFLLEPGKGFTFSPGASTGRNLKRVLQLLLARNANEASVSFDRLQVPFRAVTTDLHTGRAFAPAQGDLPSAVCASMSVPGILSPVPWRGHHLVDGVLVQNLPVETARSLDPQAAVMAVEVGRGLDSAYQTSVLGLAYRAMGISIEDRTEISRRAADLVLKPDTGSIIYLEFHHQVRAAVQVGRQAFDLNLDALEDLLYGPEAAMPAPGGIPVLAGPAPLLPRVTALAAATLPDGPRQNRHYLRWMRRIEAEGLARKAELSFTAAGPVLTLEPYPTLQRVEVEAPERWRTLVNKLLDGYRVRVGSSYNPVQVGRCLDDLVLRAALLGHPWVKVERTAFDPEQGVLQVEVQELWPRTFLVQGDLLPKTQAEGMGKILRSLEGHPVDARTVAETLMLAEKHWALEDLKVEPDPTDPSGSTWQVAPIPDHRIAIEGQLAFETTWEAHGALGVHADHVFGTDCGLGIRGSADHLQDAVTLEGSRVSGTWPRLGCRLTAGQTVYRFLPAFQHTPYAPAPFQFSLAGRNMQTSSLALEGSTRFGGDDQGMASLALSRVWNSLHSEAPGQDLPAVALCQVLGEWDDLDRCLFPSRGSLIRAKVGLGWLDRSDFWSGQSRFISAYSQLAHYWPVGSWASLEGEFEAGLGWRLPFSQWYTVGGPAFLAGTPGAALKVPNFALARVGLPIPVVKEFGANVQVVPRFDLGRLAVAEPDRLADSPQVHGLSLGVRAEVWRWFLELDGGHWFSSAPGRSEGFQLNFLVGTRPFNLWRNS